MNERITIERLSYSADAIGHRADGKVVFVPNAAPGDEVLVEIVEEKASFCRARLIEVVEASPLRVTPACPHAESCGGCSWQHLSYAAQLEAKRAAILSALIRSAHVDPTQAEDLLAPCLPSARELGYRNKLELGAACDERGVFQLGFRGRSFAGSDAGSDGEGDAGADVRGPAGSNAGADVASLAGSDASCAKTPLDLVAPDACPLAHQSIAKAPKALRGALRYLQGSQDLGIYRVGLRSSLRTKETEIALWTPPGPFPRRAVAKTLQSALGATSIVRVMADPGRARKVKGVEALDGKGFWEEELAGFRFKTSAPSFFQVNTAQAEKLIDAVIAGLCLQPKDTVADLYAGGGTFSLSLAKIAGRVIAVESAVSSVRDLRRNASDNGLELEVVGGDSARELAALGHLDALVVDPPRAGLADGMVERIAAAAPQRLAYVSCDPSTWVRDVARLAASGYQLLSAQPVDLFSQTYHVELVSIFERA